MDSSIANCCEACFAVKAIITSQRKGFCISRSVELTVAGIWTNGKVERNTLLKMSKLSSATFDETLCAFTSLKIDDAAAPRSARLKNWTTLGFMVTRRSGSSSRTVTEEAASPGVRIMLAPDEGGFPEVSSWRDSCWSDGKLEVLSAASVRTCSVAKSSTESAACKTLSGGGAGLERAVEGSSWRAFRLRAPVDGSHNLPRR